MQGYEESLHLSSRQKQRLRTWSRGATGQSMQMGDKQSRRRVAQVLYVAEISDRLGIRGGH